MIVVDEPTRGIDVGAKSEIFALIDRLAGEGLAVVMMTSEMPELLGLSDRIAVMAEGRHHRDHVARRGHAGEDPQCRDRLDHDVRGCAAMATSEGSEHDMRAQLLSKRPSRPCWRGSSPGRSWRCSSACILVIAFFSFTAENFFSVRNMTNVLGQASLALIAGIGCAIVFISGEVDISIGSLLARHRPAADRHHERAPTRWCSASRARCCSV